MGAAALNIAPEDLAALEPPVRVIPGVRQLARRGQRRARRLLRR